MKRVAVVVLFCAVTAARFGGCMGAPLVASSRPPRLCETKQLSDAFLQLEGYPGPLDKDRPALRLARISKNAVDPNDRYRALRQVAEMDDQVKWLALVDALCDEDPSIRLIAHWLLKCPHAYRPSAPVYDRAPATDEEIRICQERCWRWCVRTGKVLKQDGK